jgi:ribokinase
LVAVVAAGAINWDINLFVGEFPRPGEETPVIRITRVPGGKAGNVAVAAARLLGSGKVGIIGALGTDEISGTQLQLLNSEGVDTSAISRKVDAESGQAYIVTDQSGENLIHTHFGANAILKPTDILQKSSREMIQSARITAITDPPEEVIETITRIAHEAGRLIAWDPGIRAKLGMNRLRDILLRTDYLLLNEVEVEYMTGVSDPAEAAKLLSALKSDLTAILKSGREGCTMFTGKTSIRAPGIDLSKYGMSVVNTVGCGDAFLGAFSAAKALDLTDKEALQWANWAGALKATKPETRGSPTRKELDKWISATSTPENR